MTFCLSTHWNAYRHRSGQEMIEEILVAGFHRVELGYDLTLDLVPGVMEMVKRGAVDVASVHNFCPVPVGAPRGHPELFSLTSRDPRIRESAVAHTAKTVRFAAEMGASVVIVHAGRVEMRHLTPKLIALCEQGKQYGPRYEKIKMKAMLRRERKIGRHLDSLYASIESLLPVLQETNVRMAMENLPSWEAIPTEGETEEIIRKFGSPLLCYWHDVGHAQIRQNLGFIAQIRWLERLSPHLAGMHVHDVAYPARDHLMPPNGNVDFASFRRFLRDDVLPVFEPAPGTPATEVREGAGLVRQAWRAAEGGNGG